MKMLLFWFMSGGVVVSVGIVGGNTVAIGAVSLWVAQLAIIIVWHALDWLRQHYGVTIGVSVKRKVL